MSMYKRRKRGKENMTGHSPARSGEKEKSGTINGINGLRSRIV